MTELLDRPLVSVVIPCLDEARTIGSCIRSAREGLGELSGEVLVADNGSRDGSAQVARDLGALVVDVAERGYGSALRGGIAAAQGEYIVIGDGDESYDFHDIGRFVAKLNEGYDLVLGNRFRGGIAKDAMPWLHKYVGNPVLSTLGRLLFNSNVGDFHCGLRAFRREKIRDLQLRSSGMEFATEMVARAELRGLRLTELPTTLQRDGRNRRPHLNTWRDGWRHLRLMLVLSPRWVFCFPGIVMVLCSLILTIRLLLGPVTVNGIVLDIHTLAYCLAGFTVGFHMLLFWVLAQVFVAATGVAQGTQRPTRLLHESYQNLVLAVGFLMCAAALVITVIATSIWAQSGFGTLDPTAASRLVLPAVVMGTVGVELVLATLFASLMAYSLGGKAVDTQGAGHA